MTTSGSSAVDVGIFHVRVGMEACAQALQLADPPLDNAHEVAPPGTGRTDEDLAAERGGGLIECDGVSPLRADPRGFEPGRPAADDDNPAYRTGAFRDDVGEGQLATGRGIVQTGRPVRRLAMRRADAGPDLGLAPGGDLRDEIRIGDLSPGHSDHIDLAFRTAKRADATSAMRAAWKTGSPISRRNAPTGSTQGASGEPMPGMFSSASARVVSIVP